MLLSVRDEHAWCLFSRRDRGHVRGNLGLLLKARAAIPAPAATPTIPATTGMPTDVRETLAPADDPGV